MKKFIYVLWLIAMTFFTGCQQEYDLIIKNGTVYDGSGSPPVKADVAINKDRIVKIGDLSNAKAKRVIDATGMAVAPGFIDLHAHLEPLLELPGAESAVRQGVTTSLGGPDGSSPWPLKQYLDKADSIGMGMNVAFLIGHNTIRRNIMQLENRAPTAEELAAMEAQVEQGMQEGAFGMSTGLKYLPGAFSNVDEVIALSKVASKISWHLHFTSEGRRNWLVRSSGGGHQNWGAGKHSYCAHAPQSHWH